MRTPIYLALGGLFAAAASVALAGPLPPPPAGYKVAQDALSDALKAGGKGDGLEATKPNDNWPKCPGDADIHLRYNWRASPTADKYVDFVAKGPEDPATTMGRTKDEPAGKKAYAGGLLTWRKVTTQAVGCAESAIVTYNGSWIGAVSGKLVTVSAFHVLGAPGAGQALIDEYVAKMKASLGAAK
jgi:hypothetical protein